MRYVTARLYQSFSAFQMQIMNICVCTVHLFSRCVFCLSFSFLFFCFFFWSVISFPSPPELPAGSCSRTSLPGSTTAKQMPGRCTDMSEFTERIWRETHLFHFGQKWHIQADVQVISKPIIKLPYRPMNNEFSCNMCDIHKQSPPHHSRQTSVNLCCL